MCRHLPSPPPPARSKLSTASETIEQWLAVQSMWMYMEAVFSGGDIVKQLPQEAKRFQNIDKNFMKARGVGLRGASGGYAARGDCHGCWWGLCQKGGLPRACGRCGHAPLGGRWSAGFAPPLQQPQPACSLALAPPA